MKGLKIKGFGNLISWFLHSLQMLAFKFRFITIHMAFIRPAIPHENSENW